MDYYRLAYTQQNHINSRRSLLLRSFAAFCVISSFFVFKMTHPPTVTHSITDTSFDMTNDFLYETSNDWWFNFLNFPTVPSLAPLATQPVVSDETGHALPTTSSSLSNTTVIEPTWHTVKIKAGHSLSLIFKRLGISAKTLYAIMQQPQAKPLKQLRVGQTFEIQLNENKELLKLIYAMTPTKTLTIARNGQGYDTQLSNQPIRKIVQLVEGSVQQSFSGSAKKAGLDYTTITKLVKLMGWQINFKRDIQPGAQFRVLFENHYVGDKKINGGDIVAASFTNKGKNHTIIRFDSPNGNSDYYTPEGESIRQSLLRKPVKKGYLSSHFNLKRKHPILRTLRPHYGVDYAAPPNTPIYAAGDGKIRYLARKGGYGKTIIIQHRNGYKTLYAHLSNYAKRLKHGTTVKQGQLIGYMGSTGLATGSHLHYEIHVNGKQHDPLKVKLPTANPIAKSLLPQFTELSRQRILQLTASDISQLELS